LFEAELAHKLPELRGHEDYLTSCIFGALKYLPPDAVLFPFLKFSFNYRSNETFEEYLKQKNINLSNLKPKFHFWPRSSTYGEPDLVITLEGGAGSFIIAVEIKYFSMKHGEEEQDQLARYYLALGTIDGRETFSQKGIKYFSGDLLALVYLTQFEAELEIEESLKALELKGIRYAHDKFFHLRWQELPKIIEPLLLKEHDSYEKIICMDIKNLMESKALLPFTRFSKLSGELLPELLLVFPVFFETEDSKDKHFIGFTDLPEQLSAELLSQRPVFLH